MKARPVFSVMIADFLIELTQTGKDSFTMRYGMQVERGLSRAQASVTLGNCIFHAIECEGRLDAEG